VVIRSMAIDNYFNGGYWLLLLVTINGYFIGGYCWLFY